MPSVGDQYESKGHMGQGKGAMYSKVCKKSKSRTVYSKCMHNVESVNWRADWSKFCNRSYADVVKQNNRPRLKVQKGTKIMSYPRDIRQVKNVVSDYRATHEEGQSKNVFRNTRTISKTKAVKPETANARDRDYFQLPTKNRFNLLNQDLQSVNDTETTFNPNAPEYVPIANRQVKQQGNKTHQMYITENPTTIDTNRSNVNAPLDCSDVTNNNTGQKVRQCRNPQGRKQFVYNNPADTLKVNQDNFSAQVIQDPHQASNETHNTSRHNIGNLRDNAGAASQYKSVGGTVLKPKAAVTLHRFPSPNTDCGVVDKKQYSPLLDDEYSLAIHNKTYKKALLWQARDNTTFKI